MPRQLFTISLLFLSILAIASACCGAAQRCAEPAHRNELSCAVLHDVVDCTTTNAKTLIDQFEPAVIALLTGATSPDGVISWDKIEPAVSSFAVADGMCVLADVVGQLTRRSGAAGTPGSPTFESVSIGFDKVRAKLAPGVRFKTPSGEI